MYKQERSQLSFHDMIYDRVIRKSHFLYKLEGVIDWHRFERYFDRLYPSSAGRPHTEGGRPHTEGGRPAYNPVMMFKALVLQFLYDLSDRQLEDNLNDRLSFRYFLGIDPSDAVPDHTVYCRFRDRLGAETIAELFNEVVSQARSKRLVKDRLCIVDATHVEAKVNTFRMNAERDDDAPGSPPSRIDPDARHGYKSKNKPFFGYKVGIGVDKDTNIVTTVTATPGNEHDSTHFPDVADPPRKGWPAPIISGLTPHAKTITADKGYDSPDNFELIKDRKQKAAIMVKRRSGKQRGHIKARYPTQKAYQHYYRLKQFRSYIEKIFATAKQWYGLGRARYLGLAKMKLQAAMTMMAMNLKRMVLLDRCVQI